MKDLPPLTPAERAKRYRQRKASGLPAIAWRWKNPSPRAQRGMEVGFLLGAHARTARMNNEDQLSWRTLQRRRRRALELVNLGPEGLQRIVDHCGPEATTRLISRHGLPFLLPDERKLLRAALDAVDLGEAEDQ
jgi:hypothetical protein